MKSYINLKNKQRISLPEKFRDDDVRYTEELVEIFLNEFTSEGDVVFDPFAGFGTTLITSQRNNRKAYGIEFLEDRVEYIRSKMKNPKRLIHGDSRKISKYNLPLFDLSITSPPYMTKGDPENPFTGYQTEGDGYEAYLTDIRNIYAQIKTLMKPDSRVIIEVSNIKGDKEVTTLAWDIGKAVGEVLNFQGEIIVNWDEYGFGYEHSYCLVFTK